MRNLYSWFVLIVSIAFLVSSCGDVVVLNPGDEDDGNDIKATAPTAPIVSGTTLTNDTTPTWSWNAGGGGNGTYRYKLDNSDRTSGATETASTSYTPGSGISEGSHTHYVQERDATGNWSSSGSMTIVIDSTAPTVSILDPTNNQSSVSISDNITVTFSEAMDTTTVTTNTSHTSCSGTLQVSSDSFSTCVQMSSAPVSSNSNMTFTLDPSDNLTAGTFKIRVTTGVEDTAGNALSSQYETSNGFITYGWSQQSYIKNNNADRQDKFGIDVSLDGDTLAVSAHWEDSNQTTITNDNDTSSSDDSAGNSGAV